MIIAILIVIVIVIISADERRKISEIGEEGLLTGIFVTDKMYCYITTIIYKLT